MEKIATSVGTPIHWGIHSIHSFHFCFLKGHHVYHIFKRSMNDVLYLTSSPILQRMLLGTWKQSIPFDQEPVMSDE